MVAGSFLVKVFFVGSVVAYLGYHFAVFLSTHCKTGHVWDEVVGHCVRDVCGELNFKCGGGNICRSINGTTCDLSCAEGYVKLKGECQPTCIANCPAQATCTVSTTGACSISCMKDYLLVDGKECREIRPCFKVQCDAKVMDCNEVTTKKDGRVCRGRCHDGYVRSGDTCVPANVCADFACPKRATCAPVDGKCVPTCPESYELVVSKNECMSKDVCSKFHCPDFAVCSPDATGESCIARCIAGYIPGAGNKCVPRDAAFTASASACQPYTCPQGATCTEVQRRCVASNGESSYEPDPYKPVVQEDEDEDE